MQAMKTQLDGGSLPMEGAGAATTISGIGQNSPRVENNKNSPRVENNNTMNQYGGNTITNSHNGGRNQLKVRFDRRVHGGGGGIDNRFSYGSESISRHKFMGPADGVASPRRRDNGHGGGDGSAGTDQIGMGSSRFRMRKDRTLHGVSNEDGVLQLGSKEYQDRLRKESKAAREGAVDARRRKIKPVEQAGLNIFGGAELPKVEKKGSGSGEADRLDESLFAGMLNPKQQQAGPGDHERRGTDLRAETQLMHRQLYRGAQPQRNEISAFLRR